MDFSWRQFGAPETWSYQREETCQTKMEGKLAFPTKPRNKSDGNHLRGGLAGWFSSLSRDCPPQITLLT